jgi:hypothetical protein
MSEITKRMRKIKNRILAIPAAPAASPPNPKKAAIMAMIKKTAAQYNIVFPSRYNVIIEAQ